MNKLFYLCFVFFIIATFRSVADDFPINDRPISVNLSKHHQVQLANGFKITFIDEPRLPLVRFALAFKNQSTDPAVYLQTNQQLKFQAQQLYQNLEIQVPPFSGKVIVHGSASSQDVIDFKSLASLMKLGTEHHYKIQLGLVSQQFLSTVFVEPLVANEHTSEALESYYQKAFSAANAHLFVIGTFSQENLIAQVNQAFGTLPMESSREQDLWRFSQKSNVKFVDQYGAPKINMAIVFNDKGEKDLFVRLTHKLIEQMLVKNDLQKHVKSRFYESKNANFTLIDVTGDLATIHLEFGRLLDVLSQLKNIDETSFLQVKRRLIGTHLMAQGTYKGKLNSFINTWFENESETVWKTDLDKLQSISLEQYQAALEELNAGQVNILAIGNKAILEAELKQLTRLKDFW